MVSDLLEIVHSEGIMIGMLLMDGGFYSTELIKHLISTNVLFIMHAPNIRNACDHNEVDKLYTKGRIKGGKGNRQPSGLFQYMERIKVAKLSFMCLQKTHLSRHYPCSDASRRDGGSKQVME